MEHIEVLKTNARALRATYDRLDAREDLTSEESSRLLEVRIILESLEKEIENFS